VYQVEMHDKRIVGVFIGSAITMDEVKLLVGDVRKCFATCGGKVVATADLRSARLFVPDISDALLGLLRADNPLVERSALIIAPESATFGLQVERMAREAGNPTRKVVRSAPEASAYLGSALTPAQQKWLQGWYSGNATK